MSDNQIGQWVVVDRFAEKFHLESPYNYAGNGPIKNVDLGGNFKISKNQEEYIRINYPTFYRYITSKEGIEALSKSDKLISAYIQNTRSTDPAEVRKDFVHNMGPEISLINGDALGMNINAHEFGINEKMLQLIETSKGNDKKFALAFAIMTVLHEEAHIRNLVEGSKLQTPDFDKTNVKGFEDGDALLRDLYFTGANSADFSPFTGLRFDAPNFQKQIFHYLQQVYNTKLEKDEVDVGR